MVKKFIATAIVFVLFTIAVISLRTPVVHAQQTHSVALTWVNSTDSCVVNTNVQRVLISGTEVIGTNFAVVPVAGGVHNFTDTTVTGGGTFFYTVSAYGPNCGGITHESVLSAEFKAVIPPDCNAPSTIINGVCVAPPKAPTSLNGIVQ